MPWLPGSSPGLFPGSVIAIKATGRRSPPVSHVLRDPAEFGPGGLMANGNFIGSEVAHRGAARRIGEHVLDDVLTEHGLTGQLDRILAVEAGGAKPRSRLLRSRDHAPQGDVAQGVGPDGMPYRLEHLLLVFDGVGDQLGRRREVDTVEARPLHRW